MTNFKNLRSEPDVLEVIADLSNDEVFTSPRVANEILDMLPSDVWTNPKLRFLDPGTKTGVFLREITKRLMVGLNLEIPNELDRINHILKNMVWGVAVTELTSLMARRTLYCTKDASSKHSVVQFDNYSGNIWLQEVKHDFSKGRCLECSAPETIERKMRDNHAYAFIHQDGKNKLERTVDMRFDVIVGNPPYQMDADSEGKNVVPLYDAFVKEAISLNPSYLTMVIPSRWLAGGKGLDDFRSQMLSDKRLRKIFDFPEAEDVFPGIGKNIKGGVMYFLWERDSLGSCELMTMRGHEKIGPIERDLAQFDIFVRDARALPILEKVLAAQEPSFAGLVSTRDPFGPALSSNFKNYRKNEKRSPGDLIIFMNEDNVRVTHFVDPIYVTRNTHLIDKWKVLVPKAYGAGETVPHQIIGQTIISEPGSVCTLSYLVVGPFETELETTNVELYLKTRFARFLVSLRKISQNTTQKMYTWVPILDFTRKWTDSDLFERYGITSEEVEYIEQMVKEMP